MRCGVAQLCAEFRRESCMAPRVARVETRDFVARDCALRRALRACAAVSVHATSRGGCCVCAQHVCGGGGVFV